MGDGRLPDALTVEALEADIAVIFHWPPSETGQLSLSDLLMWRHQAYLRSQTHE
ncbi:MULTISPECIES: GpE family phage tail protein [Arsenophonus]|uniref:GpE family phage tail protein n=1 Tax=Arsenophonus TaxID=637 RepID=UPI0015D685E0|nr:MULTISPECIES: GpE family phage tail protein [Arsenophonus]